MPDILAYPGQGSADDISLVAGNSLADLRGAVRGLPRLAVQAIRLNFSSIEAKAAHLTITHYDDTDFLNMTCYMGLSAAVQQPPWEHFSSTAGRRFDPVSELETQQELVTWDRSSRRQLLQTCSQYPGQRWVPAAGATTLTSAVSTTLTSTFSTPAPAPALTPTKSTSPQSAAKPPSA
eukprot:jgi/Tetstr1/421347/TSEL_012316.t1